ncbi:hypothetical protein PG997_007747 [Apiospora hydei]|uniref:2EXR domain-containing protein n=1 Tax=Apiospora hydei TaxID=1337664 RepID=A0ABR1W8W8_9PEZI
MPCQSFHLFSALPLEIRWQIWRLSCQPRVVEVSYKSDEDCCRTTTEPPPVFHVCRESRQEASRLYKTLFGTRTHEPRIYFHPAIDTLYLPRPPYMGYDDACRDFAELVTDITEVQNLALDHVNPAIRRPWETYNKYVLMQSFTHVTEVYLVLDSNSDPTPDLNKHGFLKLTEPIGDPTSISQLLADLKDSFTYEAGASFSDDKMDEGHAKAPPLVLKSKISSSYLRLL